MRLRVDINLGNEAMKDFSDLSDALVKLAAHFAQKAGMDVRIPVLRDNGSIRDVNGNRVGEWSIMRGETKL